MKFAIPAGVFMSDHVHLLVEGLADTSDFKRFMTLMRQRSAVAFSRRFRERLWQKGYHERVLRNVDEIPSVVKYIADNARHAGIESADSYPYLWTPTYQGPR
jgi:REP element-mobilizing transposase RayT